MNAVPLSVIMLSVGCKLFHDINEDFHHVNRCRICKRKNEWIMSKNINRSKHVFIPSTWWKIRHKVNLHSVLRFEVPFRQIAQFVLCALLTPFYTIFDVLRYARLVVFLSDLNFRYSRVLVCCPVKELKQLLE